MGEAHTSDAQATVVFLFGLAAMLATALVCGQAMRRLGQPAVLGELIGGILLGPTVFGAVAPAAQAWLFAPAGPAAAAREAVIAIGMLFFLFVAGLEVDLGALRRRGRAVALTSAFGIAVPFAIGFAAVTSAAGLWRGDPAAGAGGLELPLFVATALSISALPVIARVLLDLGLLRSDVGTVVMSAAMVSGLVGWSLFAAVLAGGGSGGGLVRSLILAALAVAAVIGLGRGLGRPLLRWVRRSMAWPSAFIGVVTVLVLMAAAFSELLGLHAILGAFLLGVAFSGPGLLRDEPNHAHEAIHQFAVSFFAPLFFVSIGLEVDFVAHFDLGLVLWVSAVATVGKVLGGALGARLGGMPVREAWAVGFGLNARGAMEMILAAVALEHGIIDQRLFVALVVMALVTSMTAGPAMQRLLAARPPAPPPKPPRARHSAADRRPGRRRTASR